MQRWILPSLGLRTLEPFSTIITIITIISNFQFLLDLAVGVWVIAPPCITLGYIMITTHPATGLQITLPTAATRDFEMVGAFQKYHPDCKYQVCRIVMGVKVLAFYVPRDHSSSPFM